MILCIVEFDGNQYSVLGLDFTYDNQRLTFAFQSNYSKILALSREDPVKSTFSFEFYHKYHIWKADKCAISEVSSPLVERQSGGRVFAGISMECPNITPGKVAKGGSFKKGGSSVRLGGVDGRLPTQKHLGGGPDPQFQAEYECNFDVEQGDLVGNDKPKKKKRRKKDPWDFGTVWDKV